MSKIAKLLESIKNSPDTHPEEFFELTQMLVFKCKNNRHLTDGYHSYHELYEFRKLYNAALFNEWAKQGLYSVHKSKKHHDGEECFGGGWFIVVANLPTGQISNHYKLIDWDLFKIPDFECALFEFDGHTPTDVLTRITNLLNQ